MAQTTYTVKAGDTANKIAQRLGFSNYKEAGISGFASGNPDKIQVGEVLNIGGTKQPAQQSVQDTSNTNKPAPTVDGVNTQEDADSFINANQETDFSVKNQDEEPPVRSSFKATQDFFNQISTTINQGLTQPDLPDFATRFETLRQEQGIGKLETSLAEREKEKADIEARLRQRKKTEEGKPVALNVISGRITEAERQERENIDFVNREINYLNNQITSKNSVIENIMNFEKLDFEFANERYTKEFNKRKDMISFAIDLEDRERDIQVQTEESARANGEIFVNTMIKAKKDISDVSTTQKAQLQKWGLEAGLGKDFFTNMFATAQANDKEVLTHVTSKDKSQVTVLYKDGSTDTINTGIKDDPKDDKADEFDLATEYAGQYEGSDEELKRDLLRDSDLSVSEVNSIISARVLPESKLLSKAKELVESVFNKSVFLSRDQELVGAKKRAKKEIESYVQEVNGRELNAEEEKVLRAKIDEISLNDIEI